MNIEVKEKKVYDKDDNHKDDNNKDDNNKDDNHKNNINENIGIGGPKITNDITKEVGINTNVKGIVRFQENRKRTFWNDNKFFYNFCMIINLMIISATLSILIYYLYNLTDKIGNIDFNTIIKGLGSVDVNLKNINVFGDKVTPLINQFHNSEISDLSVRRINFLTEQLTHVNFKDFNIRRIDLLIDMLNETLYNFNNAVLQFQSPNFDTSFGTNFNTAFNPELNPNFNNIESDGVSPETEQSPNPQTPIPPGSQTTPTDVNV